MTANGGLPEIPRAILYVAAVTLIVGAGLFLLPPFGVMPLPYQLALTGAALALWCFCDGLFGRFSILLALIEAVLLLRLSVGRTRLMVEATGGSIPEMQTP
jgi:hypothetical protein